MNIYKGRHLSLVIIHAKTEPVYLPRGLKTLGNGFNLALGLVKKKLLVKRHISCSMTNLLL